jgi:hypothetical protein
VFLGLVASSVLAGTVAGSVPTDPPPAGPAQPAAGPATPTATTPSTTTRATTTTTTSPPVVARPIPTVVDAPRATDDDPPEGAPDDTAADAVTLPSVPNGPQTSCRSVVQIGDSLSVGLDSASYIEDPDARITARYAAAGVRTLRLESSGGRSVIEHLDGQDGGEVVARRLRRDGFHGCWVIALGTNDAANVDAGSAYGYSERIDRMMAIIGDDPVLWVDVKTLKTRGHYAGEHMRMFNQALAKAHARYPALQVFAWSDVVADDWFQSDGIHYTTTGDGYRAALVPAALAAAFPA